MSLRATPGSGIAAGIALLRLSGLLRLRGAAGMLRRGGLAAAAGLAALRSPDRPVLVRGHDALTGAELDAAVTATAAALAERLPTGARLGLRGDGGIEFVVALAAAGLAGVDVLPIGPRHADADVAALARDLDELADPWELVVRGAHGAAPPASRPPGRLLLLSTGTTGAPGTTTRGRLGARGLLQLADADRRLALPPGPVLVLAPPDHGHGLSMVLAGLLRGRTVLLGSGMRPEEQAELVRRRRPATVTGVPAQLGRLLEADAGVLAGVRLVVSGSSLLPAALRERIEASGAAVRDCYGSTETGTVAIEGRPLAGVTIAVGGDRRIRVSSPLGGAPREPGDLGRIEHGRLHVEGRAGELVDSGGELVAPARVEAALRGVAGVVTARVTAEPDDLLGTRLHAGVVVADPRLDAAALTRALEPLVGRSGLPRSFDVTVG